MAYELVYTSAEQGLKKGSSGFCTVACTRGMPRNLINKLESLSGYDAVFPPHHEKSDLNPTSYSHYRFTVGNRDWSFLSRVAFAGVDHTNRSNKLATHLVLNKQERPTSGPAWLLHDRGVVRGSWDGSTGFIEKERNVPQGHIEPQVCERWGKHMQDPGWGGVLADAFMENPKKPSFVIFEPGMDVLPLVAETVRLLPPQWRWNVTFNTYFTSLPMGTDCAWRFCLPDADVLKQARRMKNVVVLDLRDGADQGKYARRVFGEKSDYITMARKGASAAKYSSPQPEEDTSEVATIASPSSQKKRTGPPKDEETSEALELDREENRTPSPPSRPSKRQRQPRQAQATRSTTREPRSAKLYRVATWILAAFLCVSVAGNVYTLWPEGEKDKRIAELSPEGGSPAPPTGGDDEPRENGSAKSEPQSKQEEAESDGDSSDSGSSTDDEHEKDKSRSSESAASDAKRDDESETNGGGGENEESSQQNNNNQEKPDNEETEGEDSKPASDGEQPNDKDESDQPKDIEPGVDVVIVSNEKNLEGFVLEFDTWTHGVDRGRSIDWIPSGIIWSLELEDPYKSEDHREKKTLTIGDGTAEVRYKTNGKITIKHDSSMGDADYKDDIVALELEAKSNKERKLLVLVKKEFRYWLKDITSKKLPKIEVDIQLPQGLAKLFASGGTDENKKTIEVKTPNSSWHVKSSDCSGDVLTVVCAMNREQAEKKILPEIWKEIKDKCETERQSDIKNTKSYKQKRKKIKKDYKKHKDDEMDSFKNRIRGQWETWVKDQRSNIRRQKFKLFYGEESIGGPQGK